MSDAWVLLSSTMNPLAVTGASKERIFPVVVFLMQQANTDIKVRYENAIEDCFLCDLTMFDTVAVNAWHIYGKLPWIVVMKEPRC